VKKARFPHQKTTRGRGDATFEFALSSSTFFMPDAKRKSTRVLSETRGIRGVFSRCVAANGKREKPSATGKVEREDAPRARRNADAD
jgi:hypothetical protein